jgi:hypothetical protein
MKFLRMPVPRYPGKMRSWMQTSLVELRNFLRVDVRVAVAGNHGGV